MDNATEWPGYPDSKNPDNFWIDADTGERVCVKTGKRTPRNVIHAALLANARRKESSNG
jgi:hypothetical protein